MVKLYKMQSIHIQVSLTIVFLIELNVNSWNTFMLFVRVQGIYMQVSGQTTLILKYFYVIVGLYS